VDLSQAFSGGHIIDGSSHASAPSHITTHANSGAHSSVSPVHAIYTHVLNRRPGGVKNPADRLPTLAETAAVPSSLDDVRKTHRRDEDCTAIPYAPTQAVSTITALYRPA
jgi:hypothetical protein